MRHLRILFAICWSAAALPALAQESEMPPVAVETPAATNELDTVKVELRTNLGAIVLSIEKERAPITAGNFLRYVDQKRLDGVTFYRAVKVGDAGEYGLVQGGPRGDPKRVLKPIAHEPTTTTGLSHVSGAISMAREEPGSADADFFIVVGDLTTLDAQPPQADPKVDTGGYAVFGRVTEGMEVIKAILELPRSTTAGEGVMKGQMLEKPVKILTVRRLQ